MFCVLLLSLPDWGLTPETGNPMTNIGQAAVVAGGTITIGNPARITIILISVLVIIYTWPLVSFN